MKKKAEFRPGDINVILDRIGKITVSEMTLSDQMLFALNVAKFAESMLPLVEKYVPDLDIDQDDIEPDLFAELRRYFKGSDDAKD